MPLSKSNIVLTEKLALDAEKYEIKFTFKRDHIQGSAGITDLGLLCVWVSPVY